MRKLIPISIAVLLLIQGVVLQRPVPAETPAAAAQSDRQIGKDPFQQELDYVPRDEKENRYAEEYRKISASIDILINWNIKLCSTCESLNYFAIKFGPNSITTLNYLTVAGTCAGTINLLPPSGPSGRPGNNQLLIATQLQDETWLLQPRICPGYYIKATSASTLAVVNGLSSNARFWIEYHDNHVHLQSGFYTSSYWNGGAPIEIGPGASMYIVEFWPSRAWP